MIASSTNRKHRFAWGVSRKVIIPLNPNSARPSSQAQPDEIHLNETGAYLTPSEGNIPPPGQYCVYAILCDDNSLYIGYTNNLSRRWREHQSGSAARWTKKHKPQRIAYFELAPSREAAMRLERQWKAPHRRKRLKRLVGDNKPR